MARRMATERKIIPIAVPPDEALEAMLVGYCLDGAVHQVVQAAVETLDDDAVRGRLAPIWRAIRQSVLGGTHPTVPEVVRRAGAPWTLGRVLDLVRSDLTGGEIGQAMDSLVEISRRRTVMESLIKAWDAAGQSADSAIAMLQDVVTRAQENAEIYRPHTIAELAEQAMLGSEAARAARERGAVPEDLGLPTGLWPLDVATGGLTPGDLWVLAARTSQGKTSFALQVAEAQTVPVHFASAEVPAARLGRKALASAAVVPVPRVRQGSVTDDEARRLRDAVSRLAKTQVVVDDRSRTVEDLRISVMRTARRYGSVGLVVVDYLQLMEPDGSRTRGVTRQERVGAVSRGLKLLALDMHVPVLALAQLSRGAEDSQEPELRHLRESGSIEQDADVVVFLHRPRLEDGPMDPKAIIPTDAIVAKNRDGPLSRVPCGFDPLTQTLEDDESRLRRSRRAKAKADAD